MQARLSIFSCYIAFLSFIMDSGHPGWPQPHCCSWGWSWTSGFLVLFPVSTSGELVLQMSSTVYVVLGVGPTGSFIYVRPTGRRLNYSPSDLLSLVSLCGGAGLRGGKPEACEANSIVPACAGTDDSRHGCRAHWVGASFTWWPGIVTLAMHLGGWGRGVVSSKPAWTT